MLVAVDGSASALRAAETVARLLEEARPVVRLLTVLPVTMYPQTSGGDEAARTSQREDAVRRAVEEAVGEPRRVLERIAGEITVTHRFGNFAEEILKEVEEWRPDVAVLGRRGRSAAARMLLGSVSQRVVRESGVPVLLTS